MKTILAAAFAAALTVGTIAAPAAQAQTSERTYENGSVWRVSAVETKPGMFNDYMKYLSTTWKAIQEAGIKRGDVVSYKVLVEDSPRDNEPNVYLMVEYKNMAVFDRSQKERDDQDTAIFGSVTKSDQANIARGAMRTGRGGNLMREMKLK